MSARASKRAPECACVYVCARVRVDNVTIVLCVVMETV